MKFLKLWLPVALWGSVIFGLSSIPSLRSSFQCDFFLRKMAHITEYFILTCLLYRAFKNSFPFQGFYLPVYLAGASLLYAVTDEVHQVFVAGRHGTPRDVLIDAIGIAAFYVVAKLARRRAATQETA